MLTVNKKTSNAHYSYIKNLSRLNASNYTTNHLTYFFPSCLQPFNAEHVLEKHRDSCRGVGGRATRVEMPKENEDILQFTNYSKQLRLPYIIYCLLCGGPLLRPTFQEAVRDHCHFTGTFRGAAHSKCNINHFRFKPDQMPIPAVFHNLKGYDDHLIMRRL